MIEPKELRIGNFVQYKDTKEDVWIYHLEHRYKSVYRINDLNDNDELEGIPLNAEWYYKFDLSNFPFEIFRDSNDNYFVSFEEVYQVNLDYVHQLQNLYFTLTGEDLVLLKASAENKASTNHSAGEQN